jgi:hypothetical protein
MIARGWQTINFITGNAANCELNNYQIFFIVYLFEIIFNVKIKKNLISADPSF